MLVVITVVAIVAGVILTQFESAAHDQLVGTAQVIAADIAHARSLAVTNNSSYKITFDRRANQYALAHSGTNSALDVLPSSAFHAPDGSTTEHTTDLSSLPLGSGRVNLAVVESSDPMMMNDPEQVSDVEFGPLGETSRSLWTTVWLSVGKAAERRFIGVEINPITGLASIGKVQTAVPYTLAASDTDTDDSGSEHGVPEYYDPA